ncbi:sulfotransferase [Micromonospora sp. BRA006-A]|nr:sulfotransferase [Micromonospora sp. BRA006-A]
MERPIFILGAPRSGTTFLGSCVGALPDVSYHFEPRLTKAVARCVYEGSWTPQRAARYFRGYYGRCSPRPGTAGCGSPRRTRRTASSCRS